MVAFFEELKTLGFVEGQNLKIVAGGFELRNDQYAEVAATLLKAAPDIVFCVSDVATRAAQESAPTLPIVGLSDDMLAAGFVRSFSHPGRGAARRLSGTFLPPLRWRWRGSS
jgi:putative ABC transport system substrate-binding protein